MSKEYPKSKNNEITPLDDDDEFGGGRLTYEKIYGKKHHNSIVSEPSEIVNALVDEDDEFGGGRISLSHINRRNDDCIPLTELAQVQSLNKPGVEDESKEPLFSCAYKIFAPVLQTNQWYIDRNKLSNDVEDDHTSITIPLVIDTEFTDREKDNIYQQLSRLGLTTQICGIGSDTPRAIYAQTSAVNVGREMSEVEPLPNTDSIFQPVDYLRSLGIEVEIWEATESELENLPKCTIVLYGHFLTAEINMISDGTVKEKIKNLQRSTGEEQIASTRRAYCQSVFNGIKFDWVSLKHVISLNGFCYEACLKLVDTGAIHGVASYKDFCDAVGWKLKYKDNFTTEEKGRMLEMAIERFGDFENYSLGDLEVYEALNAYYEQWKIVYEKLGLNDYFQCPKLTIGGTVKDLFEAALAEKLEIPGVDEEGNSIWREQLTEIVDQFIKPTSANDLRQFSTHTRALLAKVEGGRCRNNRPTDIFITRKVKGKYDAVLVGDIDISGCYGEGQRNQDYFLGIPEIFDYKLAPNNDYISLRNWLKAYDVNIENLIKAVADKDDITWNNPENWGELMSGAYHARMFTKEELKYGQDYFASWFTETSDKVDLLAKTLRKMKADTELTSTDWVDFDEDTGSLKIFNNSISNGLLNHDGLQWILAICSARQRNELLDGIQILSSAVYPRSQQIKGQSAKQSLETLKTTHTNWEGKNTTERLKINGRTKIVMNFDECHAWFGINLGDLITDNLLIERKKAQKVYGKKSPLDVLFKLCVNTLYGDMVSKYFVTSNPVVGNNITARARALAWYMEKGLHGWQAITDGCQFDLSKVLHSLRDAINGEVINQHRKNSKLKEGKIKRAPLGGVKEILGYWVEYTAYDEDEKTLTKTKHAFGLKVDDRDIAPIIIDDPDHTGCQIAKVPAYDWIDTQAMKHLQNNFPLVDVLHSDSTSIKINDDLEPVYIPRKGQFIFESKDVYWCGAFHGSANYILCNPNGTVIKTRGYESKRPHDAVDGIPEEDKVTFLRSDRYGLKNNPAKDLMKQLLENPTKVKRQLPAIKKGILKITDYKNLAEKYDELGIEAGDSILRTFLMQEFSLSQFTFQTYHQYMQWKNIITHLKESDRQSLEGYFLNPDGTVDFIKMSNWVDEQIAAGIDMPFDLLCDPNRNDRRAEKHTKNPVTEGRGKGKKQKPVSLSHPCLDTFTALREQLKEKGIAEDTEE